MHDVAWTCKYEDGRVVDSPRYYTATQSGVYCFSYGRDYAVYLETGDTVALRPERPLEILGKTHHA